jgi:hypothetical protein
MSRTVNEVTIKDRGHFVDSIPEEGTISPFT